MTRQLLFSLVLVGFSSWSHAATVCLDRGEFAALIQQVEQTHKELANLKTQVSLYRKANAERKEVIRLNDEYIQVLEQRLSTTDQLITAYEQREKTAREAVERAHWWRNVGWGTAAVMTVGVLVIGLMK